MRLTPENAAKLYALVEADGVLNTTVVLTGQTPSPAMIARRMAPREEANDGGVNGAMPDGVRVIDAGASQPLPLQPDAAPSGYVPPPRGLFGLFPFGSN